MKSFLKWKTLTGKEIEQSNKKTSIHQQRYTQELFKKLWPGNMQLNTNLVITNSQPEH